MRSAVSLHLRLPRTPLAARPGGTTTCPVAITNASAREVDVDLAVLGVAATWSTVHPPRLRVPAAAEATAVVDLHPPRSAHVRAGSTPFGLQACAESGAATVAEQVLTVAAFDELDAELVPALVQGRRATVRLLMRNLGNTGRCVTVGGRAPDGPLRLDVRPVGLTLAPGTSASTTVRVRAAPASWRGTVTRREYRLVVRPDSGDPLVVGGAVLVPPVLPW